MSFWASLQIHFLPFHLSVSSQPKIWISQNLWCNNLRRLNLLCCTDFGTWKGIKSTEIDKNILNWHNTEICQFLRNTPAVTGQFRINCPVTVWINLNFNIFLCNGMNYFFELLFFFWIEGRTFKFENKFFIMRYVICIL